MNGSTDAFKRNGKGIHPKKTVIRVKIDSASVKKQRNECPPCDSWSWRKYGQKPIKGSPHPRGYYRCSSSKGCSAKKRVERCRTDESVIIVTYTSNHNHNHHDEQQRVNLDFRKKEDGDLDDETHLVQSSQICSSIVMKEEDESKDCFKNVDNDKRVVEETEDDLFDELGELPASSSFINSFTMNNFFDDHRILVFPS